MKVTITVLALCSAAAASVAGEEVRMRFGFTEIEIMGQATGGTASIGDIANPKVPFTVPTLSGETPAQIVAKMVNGYGQQTVVRVFQSLSIGSVQSRIRIEGALPGEVFLRTTDQGISTVGAVSSLRTVASHADQKVRLSWSLPGSAVDAVLVCRDGGGLKRLAGTATAFETGLLADSGFRIPFAVLCGKKDASGAFTRWSDVAVVQSDNPRLMPDDVFRITTDQEFVPSGTKGKPYLALVCKNAGTNPVSWSVASGSLPFGLVLVRQGLDVRMEGTPTASGAFPFQLRVTDATGTTASRDYTITVYDYALLD